MHMVVNSEFCRAARWVARVGTMVGSYHVQRESGTPGKISQGPDRRCSLRFKVKAPHERALRINSSKGSRGGGTL